MSDKPRERLTGKGEPAPEGSPAPTEERLEDGQHADHWVLPEEEREKGFVRPVRRKYRHVGPPGPKHPTRELTPEEKGRHAGRGYVLYEEYPEDAAAVGRYWTQEELDRVAEGGCGAVTTMALALAETIARAPTYYSQTFCARCGDYFPIGEDGEFEWLDGTRMGT